MNTQLKTGLMALLSWSLIAASDVETSDSFTVSAGQISSSSLDDLASLSENKLALTQADDQNDEETPSENFLRALRDGQPLSKPHQNILNDSLLLFLSQGGEAKDLEKLLILGANPRCCDGNSISTMHYATRTGNTMLVQRLKAYGGNINATTWDNYTPLHLATTRNDAKMVKFLLSMGARSQKDNYGNYPEDCAESRVLKKLLAERRILHQSLVEMP